MTEADPGFEALLLHLKEQRGFDFTGYKRASLLRRFRRQMTEVGVESFDDYLDFLLVHPDGFTALFNTILINVTSFFRDPEAWDHLRTTVLPTLVDPESDGPVRAWSAGCASGEEAYSLAMLLAEHLGLDAYRRRVKVYGTDVDEDALATARQASYTERDVRGIPDELLARYFDSVNGRHVVTKDLRRAVIFGRNDLVQDAPISHVDLLACRNTLMYFNAETQSGMVNRLHFALQPRGVLFLGKAETLLTRGDLFTPLDLRRRFFRKRSPSSAPDRRFVLGDVSGLVRGGGIDRIREEALLAAPVAQVVLDADNRLVLASRRAEVLFGLSDRDLGRPLQDLQLSYRPAELRSLIDQAMRQRQPVWVREVDWRRNVGDPLTLDVQIVPLVGDGDGVIGSVVIFNDVTRYRQLQSELEVANRQLETAYEELQSTNEELETTNEELQSTVEELETTNEELQSTNEELETMNEELQSMNDELQSGNEELRTRTAEVDRLNGFMEAVLSGLHAGIAVVDEDLRVMAWNERAADLWGVRQDEAVGRHLLALDIGLPLEDLRPLLRRTVAGDSGGGAQQPPSSRRLSAVNRRGRTIEVTATVTALGALGGWERAVGVDGGRPSGAILVMDVEDP